jgi:hypothetical protein
MVDRRDPRYGSTGYIRTINGEMLSIASHTILPTKKAIALYFRRAFPLGRCSEVCSLRLASLGSTARAIEWDESFKNNPDPRAASMMILIKSPPRKLYSQLKVDDLVPFVS